MLILCEIVRIFYFLLELIKIANENSMKLSLFLFFSFVVSRGIGIISKSYIVAVDDRNSLSGTATCYGRIISVHFQKDCQKVSYFILGCQEQYSFYFCGKLSYLFQKKLSGNCNQLSPLSFILYYFVFCKKKRLLS